ncbi:hypothetical protein [Megalodesulfovibrio gigas]|uniref:hypothetical protein n=1 Tax=Megalodesulfovibrio gigas TaxID=879 RepID=UPI001186D62E|nr:hypothetical protein [Megalodesulfovibrio gigas]
MNTDLYSRTMVAIIALAAHEKFDGNQSEFARVAYQDSRQHGRSCVDRWARIMKWAKRINESDKGQEPSPSEVALLAHYAGVDFMLAQAEAVLAGGKDDWTLIKKLRCLPTKKNRSAKSRSVQHGTDMINE